VIVRVAGKEIRSAGDLTRALAKYDPGDSVTIEVVDPLGPRRVTLKLARRPATIG
jgi:S1-C subfamily serine protease